jgi:hypothetical protein
MATPITKPTTKPMASQVDENAFVFALVLVLLDGGGTTV